MTATISDHLPQFAIIPNMFGNIPGNKSNIYERDWYKFDQESFILGCFSMNLILITRPKYIQMKLICYSIPLHLLKFKSKPWITLRLQKSIFVESKLLTIFINKEDPIVKEEFHTNYKKYRNLLSILMKKSKQAYYDKYFEKKLE